MKTMEFNNISQTSNRQREQKDVPRDKKFGEFLERVSEIDESREEKKEDPLIDGPVSPSFRAADLGTTSTQKTVSPAKLIEELTETLAPKILHISSGGISKTTIFLQSQFLSEIEIDIDHYDTDPSRFILTFRGNEQAQNFLIQHQAMLASSLTRVLPTIHFTMATPTFLGGTTKRSRNSKNRFVKTTKVEYRPDNTGESSYE